jgi:hypothetical protein
MYKIIVKGEAKTDYPNLEELHGIDCQDRFSEYFDKCSYDKNVTGGYMNFRFEDGKLWTYTTYTSDRELTSDELDDLLEYTIGQWSDGIGEGFEQEACYYNEDDEVFISPWFYGQKVTIIQEKI